MADALDWLRQALGGSPVPAPVSPELSPEELAAFMRTPLGSYTSDPRVPRGVNAPPAMQSPFGFSLGAQTRPFDYQAGVNLQLDPFDLGLSMQRNKPRVGGSLMYRHTVPF